MTSCMHLYKEQGKEQVRGEIYGRKIIHWKSEEDLAGKVLKAFQNVVTIFEVDLV